MNYVAGYNRVIGGMFLIQKRGACTPDSTVWPAHDQRLALKEASWGRVLEAEQRFSWTGL